MWRSAKGLVGVALVGALLMVGCSEDPKPKEQPKAPAPKETKPAPPKLKTPDFDAQSAYDYIQKQVDFGPRVPNSEEHKACAAYLADELRNYNLKVTVQEGEVEAYNGTKLQIQNIIGQFQPEAEKRVMLFAHWDTRPFADRDTKGKAKPIDGANDGGSGVGVLLEIARILDTDSVKPRIGVDIIFFDAEDYGKPGMSMTGSQYDSWCLGTQYWAVNQPIPNYKPEYGILLDMVGAKDAIFPKEGISMQYAPYVVNKVWKAANELGYGKYFSDQLTGQLIDDHRFVNSIAKIPSIDIVHYDPATQDFGPFHHRHTDNMDIIDKEPLKAVGQTVLEVIYSEY